MHHAGGEAGETSVAIWRYYGGDNLTFSCSSSPFVRLSRRQAEHPKTKIQKIDIVIMAVLLG